MTSPVCYLHDGTPASETCPSCLRPICSVCAVVDGMRILCPQCVGGARRKRLLTRSLVAVLLVALFGGGGFALRGPIKDLLRSKPKPKVVPPFNYGQYTPAVRELEAQLLAEPCDRRKILSLAETYYKAGDYRGVITRCDEFIKRCGKNNRLLWLTYEAHKQLSEWKQAVADASALIADEPYDHDFRWWRGVAHEQLGALEKAAEDFQQSITLLPNLRSIPINLADVLEKLGRQCEAILPLEQLLHYYPTMRNVERLRDRVERLYALPACAPLAGQGKAVVRRSKGATVFLARVSINGGPPGRFIVDTGASLVSLAGSFAAANGIKPGKGRTILLRTANGVVQGSGLILSRVSIGELGAAQVRAVVVQNLGGDVDGLLGLSFLSRFAVRIEPGGAMVIAARR